MSNPNEEMLPGQEAPITEPGVTPVEGEAITTEPITEEGDGTVETAEAAAEGHEQDEE